jgi:NRPS condensation-like uncharacterized protein
MGKNFKKEIEQTFTNKGMDNVFRATVKELGEKKEVKAPEPIIEKEKPDSKTQQPKPEALVCYNLRYPKDLKKRIKRFCIENEGIDMKDVFTQGAIMFMNQHGKG